MNKTTCTTTRRAPAGPACAGSKTPLLRYKQLAFSLALAAGSLSVAGVASAAPGVAAGAGPTGGTVVGGIGSITRNGVSTVINQQSKLLSLNWQTFNVGKDASVLFNQPSVNAVALNRILDQNPSQIFGRIDSNGQIFLINTHGIIFGSTAQLNVGGLVASTLDLTPDDFLKQNFELDAHGGHAGIVNQGTIAAASGGSVSLIGGHVENQGVILANYGHINLDGADKAVLDFDGDGLVNVQITGALKQRLNDEQSAVVNKGSLRAQSGTVVLQASAAKDLFTNLVNNSGVIDAHGISTDGGVVRLVGNGGNTVNSGSIDVSGVHGGSAQVLSDRDVDVTGSVDASGASGGGSIRVGGGARGGEGLLRATDTTIGAGAKLTADATQSGNGGSIAVWGNDHADIAGTLSARGGAQRGNGGSVETSGEHVHIADGTRVNTLAANGASGNWLIDPQDFTIAASGGDITGATLGTNLGIGDITLISSMGGTGGSGNINVNDAVNWSANTLTLTAAHNVNINAVMTASGTAGLALNPATTNGADTAVAGGTVNVMPGSGRVDFTGTGNSLSISGTPYTIITALGASGSTSKTDLQGINGDLAGHYALGADINAAATSGWSGGKGFKPLGDDTTSFSGVFDGLGHTISNITINPANSVGYVGLFGEMGSTGLVRNVGLVGGSVTSGSTNVDIGALIGQNWGTVYNVFATTTVTGSQSGSDVGGLIGQNLGSVSQAYATGAVSSGAYAGGLVGLNNGGTITEVYATGSVAGAGGAGGLAGGNAGTITDAYATGTVSGAISGGLVGLNSGGSITDAYATGAVSAVSNGVAGGLVGGNAGAITDAYATGTVSGGTSGGLVAQDNGGTVTNGYWDTQTTGVATSAGGTGLTTAQLQSGLPTGFSSPTWSIVAGASFPYLSSQFAPGATPVALSGTLYTDAGTTAAGGVTVHALNNGNALGTTTTYGNGYFYYLFDPSTLSGNNVLVYAKNYGSGNNINGVAFGDGYATLPALDIFGNALNVYTGAVAWSTVLGDLAGAEGGGATAATALTTGLPVAGLTSLGVAAKGAMNFDAALDWSGSLAVTTQGAITQIGDLTVSGTSNFDAGTGAITLTNAGNDFTGGVTAIGTGVALTDTNDLTIASLDAGTGDATLDASAGTLSVNGTVSGKNVSLSGGSGISLAGNVTSTGTQTYNDAVTLGANVTASSSGSGAITFNSTVDGAHALTVNTTGATTFGGVVGGTTALTSLTTNTGGSTTLGGNVSTTGAQTYNDAVTLGADVTAASSGGDAITFNSKVDGAHNLVVNTTGATTFGGVVGGATALISLSTNTNGSTTLKGNVTTTGAQTYGDVALGADVTAASSGGGAITFNSTVDGAHNLAVNTTGATTFGGVVGGTTALTSLTIENSGSTILAADITTTGNQTYNDALSLSNAATTLTGNTMDVEGGASGASALAIVGNAVLKGTSSLSSLSVSGTSSLQGSITTSGTQTFSGATTLTGDTALVSNGSGASGSIDFGDLVDGGANLGVTSTAGSVSFAKPLGSLAPLSSLTVDAGSISLAGDVSTSGTQSFTGALGFGSANTTLAGSTVTLDSALNQTTENLTITGNGTFDSTVDLASLNVSGKTTLDGNVTTSGTQTYSGAVTLGNDVTATSSGNGAIDFASTVDGAHALNVNTGGATTFGGAVGGTTALTSLSTTGGSTTLARDVKTTGAQTYNDAVRLTGDVIAASTGGGNIGFASTVDGAHALTVNTTGAVTFAGTVGGATELASLDSSSGTFSANALNIIGDLSVVTTGGAIVQGGAWSVGGASDFDAGLNAITLANTNNDFTGAVTLTGGTSQIADRNALTLGTVDTTGALTANSGGDLNLGSGSIGGNLSATSSGGAISQASTGSLLVNGNSNLAATGAITLANANNDFQGSVTASGTGVSLRDTNDLTIAALTDNNNGSVSLVAGGNLNLPAGTINTGTGNLTLAANGGTLSANGALSGNNVSLSGYNGLLIANDITAADTLNLVSGNGAITQSGGVLTANSLTGSSAGATTLMGLNHVTNLGAFSSGGDFAFNDAQSLIVNSALSANSGAGNLTLTTTGASSDLTLATDISGNTVTLGAGRNLSQSSGTITANTLTGSAAGSATLSGANLITDLGNFNANGFELDNAQALNVSGSVNGGAGATVIATGSGALTVNGGVSGTAVTLDGNGGLAINAAVNSGAGTTILKSGSTIGEGAGGVIVAGTLTGTSTGATTLGGANQVGTLGDFGANGFSLTDAQSLMAAGVIDGGASGTTLKTTSGDLTINGTVGNTGAATTLTSAGTIGEGASGVVNASTLTGKSSGTTTLDGANQIVALGDFSANGLTLTDARSLTVTGAVNGGTGAAAINTTGAGSDLTLGATGSIAANGVTLGSSGAINANAGSSVTSNNAALSLSGTSLALDGALNAGSGTATLDSSGAITQNAASGVITAGTLTGNSAAATTLNGANKIAALGNFGANGLQLTNAQSLAVNGTADGGSGGTSLKTTTGDLTINGTVGNTGATTTLTSAGAIAESASGVVKAATLTGSSSGTTALNGANQIASLGNFTANGFSLTDAQSLAVANGSTVNGGSGGTTLATVGAGHNLNINGTVGNSTGTTSLTSAGSIGEGAGGVVVAKTLTGSSVGDTTLNGANHINTLGQFSAANLSLVNAQGLSVVGPLSTATGTGNISLTTTGAGNVLSVGQVLAGGTITLDSGGALNVVNAVQGSAVNLAADGNLAINAAVNSGAGTTTLSQSGAGSISEGASGSITAATLTGSSQGATALDGANQVATLGDFTANGFGLTNAQALTVAGTVDGGAGAINVATTAGALTVFGDIGGGSIGLNGNGGLNINGSLDSGGGATKLVSGSAISEGNGGLIKAGTLTGSSAGTTTLNGANSITSLGNFTANGFSLTNAKALTLASGATVNGGSSTSLKTTSGGLIINGVLKGTSTKLISAAGIGEGAHGVINAGTLTGSASGAANLGGANQVANLGDFTAGGFNLTNAQSLALASGATVDGGASTALTTTSGDLAINGTLKGDTTTLKSAGAITEGAGGVVQAGTLTGSSIADTTLQGSNRIGTLGAFNAKDLYLTDAQALVVDGPVASTGNAGDISLTTTGSTDNTLTVNQAVQGRNITLASAGDLSVANTVAGSAINLTANGDLAINAAVNSGTGVVKLAQAGTGAITEGATGAITAGTLSGSSIGQTTLGTATGFMNNQVDVLGNFSSPAGFSFTNGRTLTLSSVDGSAFTVDAGQSNLYLAVRNGDLLESGNTWLYDGQGTWSSSGHIGMSTAPIYVVGVSNQFVQGIGLPPAYFYALDANGKLLPITGGPSVNVPTAALSGGSESTNGHTDKYIDTSVFTANYRSFGIVPSGILLPEDQQVCTPYQQAADECPEEN